MPDADEPGGLLHGLDEHGFQVRVEEGNSRSRVDFFAREAASRGLGEAAASKALEAVALAKKQGAFDGEKQETTSAKPLGGAGWATQFYLLSQRAHKCQRRDVVGVGVTVFLDIIYALLLAALYRGVGDDQEGVQNRLGCLFFICLNLAYSSALPPINLFAAEKNIVIREQASGAYATSAYYLSKLVAELPKLSSKFVFCTLVYWIVGFNPDPVRYLNSS